MSDRHPLTVPFAFAVLAVFAGLGWSRPALLAVPQAGPAAPPPAPEQSEGAADPGPLPGLDLSHFQGAVDWSRVVGAGLRFAYAKATEGVTYVDPRYASNAAGAVAQGLPFGGYHFYRPEDDPVAQAEHFLSTVTVGPGSLPPALDVEVAAASGTDLAAGVAAWVSHVVGATGCRPVIYASRSFWEDALEADLGDAGIWLAEYADAIRLPRGAPGWVFWQHSDKGAVPGIAGTVDLDLFDGDGAALSDLLCT